MSVANQRSTRLIHEAPVGLSRPVPLVKDRWESIIPVPSDQTSVHYRFKFDYQVNAIPVPHDDSKLSPEYKLQILDKK